MVTLCSYALMDLLGRSTMFGCVMVFICAPILLVMFWMLCQWAFFVTPKETYNGKPLLKGIAQKRGLARRMPFKRESGNNGQFYNNIAKGVGGRPRMMCVIGFASASLFFFFGSVFVIAFFRGNTAWGGGFYSPTLFLYGILNFLIGICHCLIFIKMCHGTARKTVGSELGNRTHGSNEKIGSVYVLSLLLQLGAVFCLRESVESEWVFWDSLILATTCVMIWFPFHLSSPWIREIRMRPLFEAYDTIYRSQCFRDFRKDMTVSLFDVVFRKISWVIILLPLVFGLIHLLQWVSDTNVFDSMSLLYCISLAIINYGLYLWIEIKNFFSSNLKYALENSDMYQLNFQLSTVNEAFIFLIVSLCISASVMMITRRGGMFSRVDLSVCLILMINSAAYAVFPFMLNSALKQVSLQKFSCSSSPLKCRELL